MRLALVYQGVVYLREGDPLYLYVLTEDLVKVDLVHFELPLKHGHRDLRYSNICTIYRIKAIDPEDSGLPP